jgi:hypothetical protein
MILVSGSTLVKYKKYPGCLKRNLSPPFKNGAIKTS